MARKHDVELCERIKELEEKVADLETSLALHRAESHGFTWTYYPAYTPPYTSPYMPYSWPNTTTILSTGGTDDALSWATTVPHG